MQHDAVWARRAQEELRGLLNGWDPIGVLPGTAGPVDEYDGLRDQLLSRLLRGEGRDEVAQFLRVETAHLSLGTSPDVEEVIDRIFDWWESVE